MCHPPNVIAQFKASDLSLTRVSIGDASIIVNDLELPKLNRMPTAPVKFWETYDTPSVVPNRLIDLKTVDCSGSTGEKSVNPPP